MHTFKSIALATLGLWFISGCNNPSGKAKNDQTTADTIQTASTSNDEEPISFQKSLSLQNISFDISTTGKGSIRQLRIQAHGLSEQNEEITHEIDGVVNNAEIEDLNSDSYPEVMIYITSAGSGSYGTVIAYSVNNGKSLSQISFPDIMEDQELSKGYMGHDEFTLVETYLGRKFPVYKEGDTNSNPTGGMRQILYKLENGEASRKFVIHKVTAFK